MEIILQGLKGFDSPKPDLEQYPTPANIAADIIYTAHGFGDISGKSIIDLGCGTGIFSIGCCLLGAESVTGIDIDKNAVEMAKENAEKTSCKINFQCLPVEEANGQWDTCIMNPPFGAQNRHADLPFLAKAMDIADNIYSLHNHETIDFLRRHISKSGRRIDAETNYKFRIPHTFEFHRKENAEISVTMLRIVRT